MSSDYSLSASMVADTVDKLSGSRKLTQDQRTVLAGSIAVMLDAEYKRGAETAMSVLKKPHRGQLVYVGMTLDAMDQAVKERK